MYTPNQFELVTPSPVEVKSWTDADAAPGIYWIGLHIGRVSGCRIVPSNGSLPLPRFMLLVGHIGVVEVPVGQLSYWQSGISIAEASHKQADAVGLSGCRGCCCCTLVSLHVVCLYRVGQKSNTSRTLHYIVQEVSLFWPTLYIKCLTV